MQTFNRATAILAVAAFVCFFSGNAPAADGTSQVQSAVVKLEAWLGANSKGWSNYLKLAVLKDELAKGTAADPAMIAVVQKQLESGAAGLELAPFQALRDALAVWSEDLTVLKAGGLPEAALASQAAYRPVGAVDVAVAKKSLEVALGKLNRQLAAWGATGTQWKTYVRSADLDAQLKEENPQIDVLRGIAQRYVADHVGLEMPPFLDASAALVRYINVLEARREDVQTKFVAHLQSLADELKKYPPAFADEAAVAVGSQLEWLDNMRQVPGLVRAVRGRYSAPNLQARVSERLVAAGIEQPVDEVAPLTDSILGTSISGNGHTVGKIGLELIESPDMAILETRLVGTVQTRTVGYNGPATIYADGTTHIAGSKRMTLDESGLKGLPATATAKTSTQITGIGARSGLVQRIATKKVYQSKGQAESIGSQHAAARVRSRIEKQASQEMQRAQNDFLVKYRNPLLRRREFPPLLKFRTTSDDLFVTALQANATQLGAPVEPPPITVASDLAVQVHESLVNNFAAAMFAGTTLTEEDLQKQVIELRGSLPDQLKSEEDRDPWSITFAKSRPITLKVTDGGFQITIRGQRYTSGDRTFQAMNVTADYKMQIDGPGAKLVRQGELQIFPPGFVEGRDRMTTQQISWKTTLARRFGKVLEPEIKAEGLILPGKWRQAGILDLKQLQTQGGWLAMAWIESGKPAPPEEAPAKDKVAISAR